MKRLRYNKLGRTRVKALGLSFIPLVCHLFPVVSLLGLSGLRLIDLRRDMWQPVSPATMDILGSSCWASGGAPFAVQMGLRALRRCPPETETDVMVSFLYICINKSCQQSQLSIGRLASRYEGRREPKAGPIDTERNSQHVK